MSSPAARARTARGDLRPVPPSARGTDAVPAPTLTSVVVPMYNEETNVVAFVDAVTEAMAGLNSPYEVILVDDGATDSTWERIQEAASSDARIKGISLSRNFGHQNALFAGLHFASGEAVISMDGDLQHPPSAIPELVQAWRNGYQVVGTRRIDSPNTSAFKRVTSRWFYRVFSRLSNVRLAEGSSDFRLLDRRALDALLKMRDVDLFVRGLVNWMGFRTTVVPYQAAERFSGVSKYSLRSMVRFSMQALLSFSMLPLRIGIWAGFVTSLLALVELTYILIQYVRGATVPGWASVMALMSIMFAVLFVLVGILGTYLARIYEILKGRPRFLIGDTAGFPKSSDDRTAAPQS